MTISFIGTGNMGSALAKAVAKKQDSVVLLYDADAARAAAVAKSLGGRTVSLEETLSADFLFLGVKPQVLPALAKDLAPLLQKAERRPVLVTMAAGKSMAFVRSLMGNYPIIRIMPNTPVSVGEGVVLYCGCEVEQKTLDTFAELMSEAGLVQALPEEKIDAASALTGCGPAFVYLFLEALADGAVACGLPRDLSTAFAAATLKGSAALALASGENPGKLKDAVCSPGGTTIEGVRALEENGFRGAAMDAVIAAYQRTLELGKA
ncbi:MAG: pyrroline-5-carboxylate reductase [Clostridia bacterium]|nr:pyrroline-5-carboxylate reductase [Clostridia bacterium]